jgi:hypothetical protein
MTALFALLGGNTGSWNNFGWVPEGPFSWSGRIGNADGKLSIRLL